VLGHELDLPLDPVKALQIALRKVVRHVDTGRLSGRQELPFVLMSGIGLDAYVVSRVKPEIKRVLGMAHYSVVTLKALISYPSTEFRVVTPDGALTATSCIIANARSYGGGLSFTPAADMCDGLFDVLVFRGRSKMSHLRLLLGAWLGKPRPDPEVQFFRVPSLRVEGPRGVWVQADGDLVGTLPLDFTVQRSTLPVIVNR
jgi:diacylglycerol kinase (ATP)